MGTSNSGVFYREDGTSGYRRTIRINGKKLEKKFSRKVDADRWYQEKLREKELVESGMSPTRTGTTLKTFADEWMQKRKDNGKPMSSWAIESQRMRDYVLPKFGSRSLDRITTREWETLFDALVVERDLSPATRNRIRAILSKMYNDAIRLEVVASNPVSLVSKLKESMDTWDYWHSADEVHAYLSAAKSEGAAFQVFAHLALNTGARIGEILALRWADINFSQRRFRIAKIYEESTGQVVERTKSHVARWLGINEGLNSTLLELRNQIKPKSSSDYLVLNNSGEIIREKVMRTAHCRVCKQANLKVIRIHDLRHTYASHYIMNGGGLAELQMLLGHSTPIMTQKYAHLSAGFLESKASVVSFTSEGSKKIISIAK